MIGRFDPYAAVGTFLVIDVSFARRRTSRLIVFLPIKLS